MTGLRTMARMAAMRAAVAVGLDRLAFARACATGRPWIRVMVLHGTPRRHEEALRRQLEWVVGRFEPLDLDRFAKALVEPGRLTADRPGVLFTFDDGFRSNYEVAAPMLEAVGARGVFFVVPAFIASADDDAARKFLYTRILSKGVMPTKPVPDDDWRPMTPRDLADLVRRGHAVGNHTRTHCRLDKLPSAEIQQEIEEAANTIERWTGAFPPAFAWTYAWNVIRREAWDFARQHHALVFSPCPGIVEPGRTRHDLLWRTIVEPDTPEALCRFLYSGLVDPIWRSRRERLVRELS